MMKDYIVTIGGERQLLAVDQVVICAGQSAPRAGGSAARGENGASHRRLRRGGGAGCAPAIAQGTKLALAISSSWAARCAFPGYHDNPAR